MTKEEIQRRTMINEYNRNNTDTQILHRKVNDDDIKELEELLKNMQEEQSTKTYLIADKDNAKRVFDFFKDWNNSSVWNKDSWRGVLKFDEYLNDWLAKFENEECDMVFDFPAMSYAYNMLMNNAGVGIEAARYMQSVSEQYDAVMELLNTYVKDFQDLNEKFKTLQDCLAARYQGFMMVTAEMLNEKNVPEDEIIAEVETLDDAVETVEDTTEAEA